MIRKIYTWRRQIIHLWWQIDLCLKFSQLIIFLNSSWQRHLCDQCVSCDYLPPIDLRRICSLSTGKNINSQKKWRYSLITTQLTSGSAIRFRVFAFVYPVFFFCYDSIRLVIFCQLIDVCRMPEPPKPHLKVAVKGITISSFHVVVLRTLIFLSVYCFDCVRILRP